MSGEEKEESDTRELPLYLIIEKRTKTRPGSLACPQLEVTTPPTTPASSSTLLERMGPIQWRWR